MILKLLRKKDIFRELIFLSNFNENKKILLANESFPKTKYKVILKFPAAKIP